MPFPWLLQDALDQFFLKGSNVIDKEVLACKDHLMDCLANWEDLAAQKCMRALIIHDVPGTSAKQRFKEKAKAVGAGGSFCGDVDDVGDRDQWKAPTKFVFL